MRVISVFLVDVLGFFSLTAMWSTDSSSFFNLKTRLLYHRRWAQSVFETPNPALFLRANGWGFFIYYLLFLATFRVRTWNFKDLGIPLALRTSGVSKRLCFALELKKNATKSASGSLRLL